MAAAVHDIMNTGAAPLLPQLHVKQQTTLVKSEREHFPLLPLPSAT